MKQAPFSDRLAYLLREARSPAPRSPREIWLQRVSFAYGILPKDNYMTKDQVAMLATQVYGPCPDEPEKADKKVAGSTHPTLSSHATRVLMLLGDNEDPLSLGAPDSLMGVQELRDAFYAERLGPSTSLLPPYWKLNDEGRTLYLALKKR